MQNITRAVEAGINLLEGRDKLPIAPNDIEALAELKGLLRAVRVGQLVIATPDKIKEEIPPQEGEI